MIPDQANYKSIVDGKATDLYVLTNPNQMKVAITNYGGRVVSILVADKDGNETDVALGYENLSGYQKEGEPYFGAIIGRVGNRIGNAEFTLGGVSYPLLANNGSACLHGGQTGFHSRVWEARQPDSSSLELSYTSPDGEDGFPGNVSVKVVYTLTAENELKIDYTASTDKTTVLNLTNHTYFNLNGEGNGDINDHVLKINASRFTLVDDSLIPTGEIKEVSGTPFDFRQPRAIGERVDADDEQLKIAGGYDHNFVLDGADGMKLAAVVSGPASGIIMEVFTTEPGVQLYGGNFLDGKDDDGKAGKRYPLRSGFCLETQHFPDSPNKPHFPSVVLNPSERYQTTTTYKFSV